MATCRELIEGFIYPHLEKFTDLVYRGGEDTEFMNVRVMDDDSRFTHGALVCGACILFAHYKKTNDPRAEIAKERLLKFIRIAASGVCKTWGKLGILRGFNLLSERGLISEIPTELVDAIKEKTNYEDFFEKDTMTLLNMATNYLQVAMACAGYRERLGWEDDGISAKISELLVNVLKKSDDGWMDDELPYGRFDRYSFILTSEFADTVADIRLPLPETVRNNLRLSAEKMLFMANASGNGILYGRSVACHGDAVSEEVLSSAFAHGLINEDERELSLSYIYAVLKKIIGFWYDSEKESFNIWFNGRSTNKYRSVARVLEVNIDMAIHLFTTLKNLERAGVADENVTESIPAPTTWRQETVVFSKSENDVRAVVIMKRGGKIAFIPFVGLGSFWGRRVAYYPFPVIANLLEASPTAEYPFMLPEYTDSDGRCYRPCQFFSDLSVTETDDGAEITASGCLALFDGNTPHKTDIPFRHTVSVVGNNIEIKTECNADFRMARTFYGACDPDVVIEPYGYDNIKTTSPKTDTDGINRKISGFVECSSSATSILGCKIRIPI